MITVENLQFSYKDREVLKGLNFSVRPAEIFGLLGPNGSGKTTLFRILSTAMDHRRGKVTICGHALPGHMQPIRKKIGIVFQSPSLDGKLTVMENLICQGNLYGLSGEALKERCLHRLQLMGMQERSPDIVEKLSGGLKRRAELAKALLHDPEILILDEPSTGLDPGARIDLWQYLKQLRDQKKMTILVTTHWMEEAERCDRIAIMDQGRIVQLGAPEALKHQISHGVLILKTPAAQSLSQNLRERFQIEPLILEDEIHIEHAKASELMVAIAQAFGEQIQSMTYRKASLEDVFLHATGHRFFQEGQKS